MKVHKWIPSFPAVFLLAAGYLGAQARLSDLPPGKWWTNRGVVRELALTPEQQEKIEILWMQNRKGFIDLKAEVDKMHLDLSDVISKEVVDETAALSAFDRVQAARLKLERATFLMRIQVKNGLTAEQQRRLEEMSARLRRERGAFGAPAGRIDPQRKPNPPPRPDPSLPPLF